MWVSSPSRYRAGTGVEPARRRCRAIVALLLFLAVASFGPPVTDAAAVDQSRGLPGFCPTATGVTVVVDFQQLGGTTIVRCNPSATPGTGLDALKGAGFQIAGVQRWGEGFVCRIENRPSAVEAIPVRGNENYAEACIDTPPAAAYWSYWHAGNNCPWTYSQWGVKNRAFVPGGFEGWSFSLNASADGNPRPRVAALRPGTAGQPCNSGSTPVPTTSVKPPPDPGEHSTAPDPVERTSPPRRVGPSSEPTPTPAPGAGSRTGSGPDLGGEGNAPGGGVTTSPSPRPSPSTPSPSRQPVVDDPTSNVAFTGGEGAPDVKDVVKRQSGSSDAAPVVAAGALVVLGLATGLTARRRRRAREA